MSYTPRRRVPLKAKSIEVNQYKSIHDLPALRRKRTLAVNRLSKTLEIGKSAETDKSQVDTFLAYFTECTRHAARFEEAHESILSLIEPTTEEAEDEIRCKCDAIYFEIIAIHRRLTATNTEAKNSFDNSVASSADVKVKLPKINLPTFSGNIKTWPEFYDVFQSLIHENKSLSDTERMHYLVSSLTGDALALVRVFPITGKYYGEAYETLIARYRDKRELAFTCWKEIQNLSLQSNNAHEFRRGLDTFHENLAILRRLELPIEHWDFILCYLLLSKLNSTMRCEFEQEYPDHELPTYATLKDFLYAKCEALVRDTHFANNERVATTDRMRNSSQQNIKPTISKKATTSTFLSNTDAKPSGSISAPSVNINTLKCTFCGEGHSINHCLSFAQKPIDDRLDHAKAHHWCFNCLKPSHGLRDCKSIFNCQKCRQRHHSLLHRDEVSEVQVINPSHNDTLTKQQDNSATPTKEQVVLTNLGDRSLVLLSTAKIEVKDSNGRFRTLRALIDSGSQAHFITERAAESLGIERTLSTRKISGLGQSTSSVSGIMNLEIGVSGRVLFNIEALTLPTICGKMPAIKLNKTTWSHVQHLPLADPECHLPGSIDILLGAEIFSSLLLNGVISGGPTKPSALNTVFGWLLTGNVESVNSHDVEATSFFASNEIHTSSAAAAQLDNELKRFWELDNIPTSTKLTPDEELCERKYVSEHSRDDSGRYIVTFPFKIERDEFPGSREVALKRFHALERRLTRDSGLRQQYNDFMSDYIESGHMSKVPINDLSKGKYYIPHHCVIRPDSSTTKLRVVFDASAKDASGISLNETLLTGEKLQANIAELLLRFRLHAVVYTADVRQMYRQILCDETQRDYQRIFWRFNESNPLIEYRLNTVTYGTSSAPHSALRTIKQLIQDHGKDYPRAAAVLDKDVYVDDIVSGCSTLKLAQQTKAELISMMEKGCFHLRKWASNVPSLLDDLPAEERLIDAEGVPLDVETSDTIKILGLKWNPITDKFMFDVKPLKRNCTKRTILSELARIFDPLGFLAPLTLLAKCYIQKLWILKVNWDETPTPDIIKQWESYCDQLDLIKTLQIPRNFAGTNIKSIQFHGFSDSSESGYGAVIYLRTEDCDNRIQVFFICAKSRVAPVKKISLPRLELCAAVLLSDLIKFVEETYSPSFPKSTTYAWSDSTVVLAWLDSPSCRWKTFVANRVSHIEDTIPNAKWNHVPTEDNPADIASRGLLPGDLVRNQLWWAGPSWLAQAGEYWPTKSIEKDMNQARAEERIVSLLVHDPIDTSHMLDVLIEKFSSIRKTQRILAYCLRFIHNCRKISSTHKQNTLINFDQRELHEALLYLVKRTQAKTFSDEISRLTEKRVLSKPMRKLNPFLDERGILRVGGRLAHSGLEFEHKHPALLPGKSRLAHLIVDAIHRENCHPGLNTVQYLITQQFWILSPKRTIRHCLSKCVKCFRARPTSIEPFMGDLPASRVNQVKPFSVVGVDYAGPFRIKLGSHRGAKVGKAYLCLFVCFTTKAVHLEVASDMSTEAYVAALRRFIGRRGRVNIIHSDNGTNFVGAANKLNAYMQQACERDQITFRFNPPSSPHFGGVWEIQVKAVKSHLYRVIGDQTLTFEELNTVFIQIEAMLNSRPLCPLSSDPNDLNVLTPGHFLTLEPLTAVPDKTLTELKLNRLGRWQLLQRFQQDFWNRWKVEYLQSLTQRTKWTKHCQPLTIGAVVLLKDENTVPLHWAIARVTELHYGADGIARVATVRTANGSMFKRALTKICVLPTESSVDLIK